MAGRWGGVGAVAIGCEGRDGGPERGVGIAGIGCDGRTAGPERGVGAVAIGTAASGSDCAAMSRSVSRFSRRGGTATDGSRANGPCIDSTATCFCSDEPGWIGLGRTPCDGANRPDCDGSTGLGIGPERVAGSTGRGIGCDWR